MQALIFDVAGERCGVDARRVREVTRAAAVSRLPGAPPVVMGVVDVRGTLAAVVDLRLRFGLPPRALDPSEHFVVADAGGRVVALRVDAVLGLEEVDEGALADPRAAVPGAAAHVAGAARVDGGLVLIHDLAAFLSAAEAGSLDRALAAAASGGGAP